MLVPWKSQTYQIDMFHYCSQSTEISVGAITPKPPTSIKNAARELLMDKWENGGGNCTTGILIPKSQRVQIKRAQIYKYPERRGWVQKTCWASGKEQACRWRWQDFALQNEPRGATRRPLWKYCCHRPTSHLRRCFERKDKNFRQTRSWQNGGNPKRKTSP